MQTLLDAAPAVPAGQKTSTAFVLTLSCPDRSGIVHAVTSFLMERNFDIIEHQQFDDRLAGYLFMRTVFGARTRPLERPEQVGEAGQPSDPQPASLEELRAQFEPIGTAFGMQFEMHTDEEPTVLVMVSRFGHCLNDLIFREKAGSLGARIAAVVSNHEDLRPMAEAAGLPFHHIAVSAATRGEAEAQLLSLIGQYQVDLVVLARYMQILSPELCQFLDGKAINIHHSFLPGFKGARPYHQAYARGVKQVGATAHYVTSDLDEGPIIEQEVARVDHSYGPEQLATLGRDIEARALSRAVRWHAEHRILRNGISTVVFP